VNNHFQNLTGGRTSRYRLSIGLGGGDTDSSKGNYHQRSRGVIVAKIPSPTVSLQSAWVLINRFRRSTALLPITSSPDWRIASFI